MTGRHINIAMFFAICCSAAYLTSLDVQKDVHGWQAFSLAMGFGVVIALADGIAYAIRNAVK